VAVDILRIMAGSKRLQVGPETRPTRVDIDHR
jgi:hypothetical protein